MSDADATPVPSILPPLPDNPIAAIFVAAILAVFTYGGWKGVLALARYWHHDRATDELDVATAAKKLAAEIVDGFRDELREALERAERARDEAEHYAAQAKAEREAADCLRRKVATLERSEANLRADVTALVTWVRRRYPSDVNTMPALTSDISPERMTP